ncbi:MAG: esterase [Bacteroidales bacterium]|nr:esterase [Bacteroidales bacterium]
MNKEELSIAGKRCLVFVDESPEVLLVEPMDERDLEFLDREIETLKAGTDRPFALATLIIEDWNNELTPWGAEPVFGKETFGNGAPATLSLIEEKLIPEMEAMFPTLTGAERILGGYSLAALFALWGAYEGRSFTGIAAASPSVWYPGWMDFVRSHKPNASKIYLSLGDKEYKSRNRTMATVEDCIREYADILSGTDGIETTLEWNQGNHFVDADKRTAKAFLWAMKHIVIPD